MKRIVKRIALVGCVLLITIPATLFIIPFFLDVQKYKPRLERQVMDAIGHPFELGDQLRLSLFPKTRFEFSDFRLANPPGFTEKDFIKAKIFEVRFNLLPFFLSGFKNIQTVRVCMRDPQIEFVKKADGSTNWQQMEDLFDNLLANKNTGGEKFPKNTATEGSPRVVWSVYRITISDGSVAWIDHHKKRRWRVSHLDMDLADLYSDKPHRIALSARWAGQPLAMKGKIGPLRSISDSGTIPVKLSISALDQLKLKFEGHLIQPFDSGGFDFFLKLSKFSIPKLATAAGQPLLITLSEKTALDKVAFKGRLRKKGKVLEISDGHLDIDDSNINFSVRLPDFSKPKVSFGCSLDQIDLNRYLPAELIQKPGGDTQSRDSKSSHQRISPIKDRNQNPLRRFAIKGNLTANKIKIGNVVVNNFKTTLAAKNGLLHFAPVSSDLYGGKLAGSGSVNIRKRIPRSDLRLYTKNIQLRPLLKDIWQKDFFAGTLNSKITLRMTGYNGVQIKRSLTGKGDIRINNGALIGIDLLAMIENKANSSGIPKTVVTKPETAFATLLMRFSINRGIIYSNNTALSLSSIRINATGKADLAKERLDIQLQPIPTSSSKEENQNPKSLIPLRIFGSFRAPEFKPDLK